MNTALEAAIAKLMEIDQESVLALTDIATERLRQLEMEGWTPQHDDEHGNGELARAGAAYALHHAAHAFPYLPRRLVNAAWVAWPWAAEWWKPKSPHRNCQRAGALLVAELARLYRKGSRAAAGA